MPVMHIVLFKLKEGVTEEAIKVMDEAVSSMGKVCGLAGSKRDAVESYTNPDSLAHIIFI